MPWLGKVANAKPHGVITLKDKVMKALQLTFRGYKNKQWQEDDVTDNGGIIKGELSTEMPAALSSMLETLRKPRVVDVSHRQPASDFPMLTLNSNAKAKYWRQLDDDDELKEVLRGAYVPSMNDRNAVVTVIETDGLDSLRRTDWRNMSDYITIPVQGPTPNGGSNMLTSIMIPYFVNPCLRIIVTSEKALDIAQ